MGERNCWTCRHDEGGTCAPAVGALSPAYVWSDAWCEHDGMPPRNTPPCPGWESKERTEYTLPPVPLDPETGRPIVSDGLSLHATRRGLLCEVGVPVVDAREYPGVKCAPDMSIADVLACIADRLMSEGEVSDGE